MLVIILVNRFMLPIPYDLVEPIVVVSLPLVNMLLRYITKTAIKLKG